MFTITRIALGFGCVVLLLVVVNFIKALAADRKREKFLSRYGL